MLVIHKIQKEVYNQLINSESENIKKIKNIFSSPIVNAGFPYLFVEINKTTIEKNFDNLDNYFLQLKIKLFDKRESNAEIIAMSNDVLEEVLKLVNITVDNFYIADIFFKNLETNAFSEINSVWNCSLYFDMVVKKYLNV